MMIVSNLICVYNGRKRQLFIPALKLGRVIRVTFSPGLTRFTIYPGLTRIGSREKQNCSFDDMETYKRYRVVVSCPDRFFSFCVGAEKKRVWWISNTFFVQPDLQLLGIVD